MCTPSVRGRVCAARCRRCSQVALPADGFLLKKYVLPTPALDRPSREANRQVRLGGLRRGSGGHRRRSRRAATPATAMLLGDRKNVDGSCIDAGARPRRLAAGGVSTPAAAMGAGLGGPAQQIGDEAFVVEARAADLCDRGGRRGHEDAGPAVLRFSTSTCGVSENVFSTFRFLHSPRSRLPRDHVVDRWPTSVAVTIKVAYAFRLLRSDRAAA